MQPRCPNKSIVETCTKNKAHFAVPHNLYEEIFSLNLEQESTDNTKNFATDRKAIQGTWNNVDQTHSGWKGCSSSKTVGDKRSWRLSIQLHSTGREFQVPRIIDESDWGAAKAIFAVFNAHQVSMKNKLLLDISTHFEVSVTATGFSVILVASIGRKRCCPIGLPFSKCN